MKIPIYIQSKARYDYGVPNEDKIKKAIAVAERKLAALNRRLDFERNPPTTKVCSLCSTVKEITQFTKVVTNIDGFGCWCKACRQSKKKMWHAEHKESENAKAVQYAKDRPAYMKARNLYYYRKNPRIEYRKEYQEKNAERLRQKRLTANAREASLNRTQKWRAENPEKSKENCRRSQAMRWFNAEAKRVAYAKIYEEENGVCYLCCKPVERKGAHFDHVVPLSKGGSHTFDNIRVTHRTCNLRKGAKIIKPGAYAED